MSTPVRIMATLLSFWLMTVLAGCAGERSAMQGPVFFPSPTLPRVQYLMGINSSADVEGEVNKVSLLSLGVQQDKQPRPIIKPFGITTARNKVYVADIAGQVAIMDLANKKFELLKGDRELGKTKKPVAVAVDEAGFIYVADVGRKEVLVYDAEGEFLRAVGGELGATPADVAVDEDRIYILDSKGAAIRALDRVTGEHVGDVTKNLEGDNRLSLPINFTLDRGTFYVTNAGTGKVTSLDRDGNFIGSFGKLGDGYGQFSRPKGVAVGKAGEVFVVDAGFQNAQIFTEKGRLLMFFGGNTIPVGGMNIPAGITVGNESLEFFQKLADKDFQVDQVIFVANQFGDPKISVYGYGKRRGIDYEKEYKRLQAEREKKARAAMENARKAQQGAAPAPAKDVAPAEGVKP